MSHSHSSHSSWPSECARCGIGPSGADCALLNGFCDHFNVYSDGADEVIWNERANPGLIDQVIAGELMLHHDPAAQKRLVANLLEYNKPQSLSEIAKTEEP